MLLLLLLLLLLFCSAALSSPTRSSIVSVAWHPNSQFLATACADKKCRVYCARGAHDDEIQLGAMEDFVEDSDPDFGDALFEFVSQGWVHDCEWSPNGKQLAFVSHDSSVSVVNFSESSGAGDAQPLVTTIPYKGLPFTTCLFSTEARSRDRGLPLARACSCLT